MLITAAELHGRCVKVEVSFPGGHVTVSGEAILHQRDGGAPFVCIDNRLYLDADLDIERSSNVTDQGKDYVYKVYLRQTSYV